MKNIQIKKLELTNYRNIEHAVYEFNGNSKIVGDNRIGKTNTLEAIYFLLTGYLLNGSSDIQAIKPLSNTRAVVEVSGTFEVEGKVITIAKKYGEDWVKQRNTGEEILKGHFCDLYYNGTKQSTVRDYNALFNEDFGITQSDAAKVSITQLLTNPFYIGDLCEGDDWKEVRKFIIELVGDVSDEDVFVKEPMTASLKPELEIANGRIDQVKKKIDGEIKGLKETLIADDAKIEMLSKHFTPDTIQVDSAKEHIAEIDGRIAGLRSSSGNAEAVNEIKSKIADVNIKISEEIKALNSRKDNSKLNELNEKRNSLYNSKSEVQSKISRLSYERDNQKAKVERLKKEKEELLMEYRELKVAVPKVETVCPTCKRPLDPNEVEKARNEIIENNKVKMEFVIADGKKKAEDIATESQKLETIEKALTEQENELDNYSEAISKISAQLSEETSKSYVPATSELLDSLTLEKNELEKQLSEVLTNEDEARRQVSTQVYELEQNKQVFQKVIDDYNYAVRQTEEKAKCEAEKVAHNKTLVQKEQLKDMIQRFIFTKLRMLDSNVSKVFGNIKFQLIKPNLNGGFDTVCKPYIYDPVNKVSTNVLWKSGSKSERVATGIAIAEAIKNKLNLSNMPYLFDEGGELSEATIKERLLTESQIICVKVQDNIGSPIVLGL